MRGFIKNVALAAGGLPIRGMPNWLRPLMGWLMPRVGPRGLEFARARVEMKAAETVLHLRRQHPRRLRSMVPRHVWDLVAPYGLLPTAEELPRPPGPAPVKPSPGGARSLHAGSASWDDRADGGR